MSDTLPTVEAALEACLSALHPAPAPERLDARSREFLSIRTGTHHDLLHPLARRGWVDWFDLEGDFDRPGAHARKVSELLARCGVHEAHVADEWLAGVGWLLEVHVSGTSAWFFQPREEDFASDWGEVGLFVLPVRHFAPETRIESVFTYDQSCCIVCIPRDAFDALEAHGFLRVVDDEERFERATEPPSDDDLHLRLERPEPYEVLLRTRLVSATEVRAIRNATQD